MNATKFLVSTAAAVTVAGAIGLAYAQTNTYNNSAGTPGTIGSAQSQTTTTGQAPANVRGVQEQRQNAAPRNMTSDSSGTNTGSTRADAMVPGSSVNANSGSTYNPPSGAAPAMGNPQAETTTISQAPATAPGVQGQRQSGALGSTTTDSSGRANTVGTATTNSNTGSNMNDGTSARTNDSSTNVRRNTPGTDGAVATERNARPDRN